VVCDNIHSCDDQDEMKGPAAMHFFLTVLVLALTLPPISAARAASSRVVDDTFRSQREQHLDDSEQLRQKFHDDDTATESGREEKTTKTDEDRAGERDKTDSNAASWIKSWDEYGSARDTARSVIEKDRADHQEKIAPRPDGWWNDKDSNNQ
jgi:hypothetical protein